MGLGQMSRKKILIHFGFPKTASTSLQFGLFRSLQRSGRAHLLTWRDKNPEEALEDRPSSRLFLNKPLLESYLDFHDDKLNILSDESLTAPVALRRHNFGPKVQSPFGFPTELKVQMLQMFPNADLSALVVLRNQKKLIYSQYVEEMNLKRYRGVDIIRDDSGQMSLQGFEVYQFARYLRGLWDAFGREKVVVLHFEDLVAARRVFFRSLAELLEININEVIQSFRSVRLNEKVKETRGYLTKDSKLLIPYFSHEEESAIDDFYFSDNRELEVLLGRELASFGYSPTCSANSEKDK